MSSFLFETEYASAQFLSTKREIIRISPKELSRWDFLSQKQHLALWKLIQQIQQRFPQYSKIHISTTIHAYIELKRSHSLVQDSDFHAGGIKDPLYPSIRRLISRAKEIDIITAFIQDSGLCILQPLFFDALQRGANIRILGGDYLHITQAKALQRLLDWKVQSEVNHWPGTLEVYIYEAKGQSFHPKCWHFVVPEDSLAYVGSSNLSFTALCRGVEWNVAVRKTEKPRVYERIQHQINVLTQDAISLHQDWINEYKL